MKKILITGAESYIGTSVKSWLKQPQFKGEYQIDTVDMRGDEWRQRNFSGYDTVFHVAGLAHADVGKVSEETKQNYYQINRDLTIETAKKAKTDGVRQFIFMSSIIVYGRSGSIGEKKSLPARQFPHRRTSMETASYRRKTESCRWLMKVLRWLCCGLR